MRLIVHVCPSPPSCSQPTAPSVVCAKRTLPHLARSRASCTRCRSSGSCRATMSSTSHASTSGSSTIQTPALTARRACVRASKSLKSPGRQRRRAFRCRSSLQPRLRVLPSTLPARRRLLPPHAARRALQTQRSPLRPHSATTPRALALQHSCLKRPSRRHRPPRVLPRECRSTTRPCRRLRSRTIRQLAAECPSSILPAHARLFKCALFHVRPCSPTPLRRKCPLATIPPGRCHNSDTRATTHWGTRPLLLPQRHAPHSCTSTGSRVGRLARPARRRRSHSTRRPPRACR